MVRNMSESGVEIRNDFMGSPKPDSRRDATVGHLFEEMATREKGDRRRGYTPTGKGLVWVVARSEAPPKRPCSNDIRPVYQYPTTNSIRNGTVT